MLIITFFLVLFITLVITVSWYKLSQKRYQLSLSNFIKSKIIKIYVIFLGLLFLLPSLKRETDCKPKTPVLELFAFTKDFITELERGKRFFKNELFAWIDNPVGYQVLFNIVIFVPIGYLLRQKYSAKKTIFIVFCVSLVIELVQLSQLFGLVLCGYRVFDVNDLVLNTVGGMLGTLTYFIVNKNKTKTNF
jgi:VanZ like family